MMNLNCKTAPSYRTRFAPSPTGPLHFGSLVSALGSWLRAQSMNGEWLIRIEDIDPPREVPGASKQQVQTLAGFGLLSDQPIVYQSSRIGLYEAKLKHLVDQRLAYWCGCSSKALPNSGRYPGTCRDGLPSGRSPRSIRLKTDDTEIVFEDKLQGLHRQVPGRETGDFIILRGDGLIAYQLAVVMDDHAQAITEVVRGADLIDSVGRQCLLYDAIGAERPQYLHLPVITDSNGRKLSKSDSADPIDRYPRRTVFRLALRALGHEPPQSCLTLEAQHRWAKQHWDLRNVPLGPISIEAL